MNAIILLIAALMFCLYVIKCIEYDQLINRYQNAVSVIDNISDTLERLKEDLDDLQFECNFYKKQYSELIDSNIANLSSKEEV